MKQIYVFVPDGSHDVADDLLLPAWATPAKPTDVRPATVATSPAGSLGGVTGTLTGIWREHLRWADVSGLIDRLSAAGCRVSIDAPPDGWKEKT